MLANLRLPTTWAPSHMQRWCIALGMPRWSLRRRPANKSIHDLSIQMVWIAHSVAELMSIATLRTKTAEDTAWIKCCVNRSVQQAMTMPRTAARPNGQKDAGTWYPRPSVNRPEGKKCHGCRSLQRTSIQEMHYCIVCMQISAGKVHIPG